MKTLIAECHQNVGQIAENHADAEVKRMDKQTGKKWRKDYSDQMYTTDETDYDVHNPCPRLDDYCFVTCSDIIENW